MNGISLIEREWGVISGAPFSVITLVFLAAVVGFVVARYRYGAIADISRERAHAAEEQSRRLAQQLEELKRTASTDAGLAELRAKIEKLPRIFVGPKPPPEPSQDGDIWFQTAE